MNVFCPHCGGSVSVTWVTSDNAVTSGLNTANAGLNVRSNEFNASLNTSRGVGGDSGSDSSSDLPDPDPSKQPQIPISKGKRGRRDETEYPLDFLVLWDLARKHGKPGNKYPAFKSWFRLNTDDHLNALILTRFEEWTKTDSWSRGFNQHLSTWLNQRGWEESPTAADLAGPSNVAPGASGSVTALSRPPGDYCDWHSTARNNNKPSFRPKSTCPECKHCAAMNGTRVSDVYVEDPMVTSIKRKRGLL